MYLASALLKILHTSSWCSAEEPVQLQNLPYSQYGEPFRFVGGMKMWPTLVFFQISWSVLLQAIMKLISALCDVILRPYILNFCISSVYYSAVSSYVFFCNCVLIGIR
jgi:hypothetical protein